MTVGAMYVVANHGRYVPFCLEEKAIETTDRSLRRWCVVFFKRYLISNELYVLSGIEHIIPVS